MASGDWLSLSSPTSEETLRTKLAAQSESLSISSAGTVFPSRFYFLFPCLHLTTKAFCRSFWVTLGKKAKGIGHFLCCCHMAVSVAEEHVTGVSKQGQWCPVEGGRGHPTLTYQGACNTRIWGKGQRCASFRYEETYNQPLKLTSLLWIVTFWKRNDFEDVFNFFFF